MGQRIALALAGVALCGRDCLGPSFVGSALAAILAPTSQDYGRGGPTSEGISMTR